MGCGRRWGAPIVQRVLRGRANRRRTYAIRTCLVLLLLAPALFLLSEDRSRLRTAEMSSLVALILTLGVTILTAVGAGCALTAEEEGGTGELIRLAGIPWWRLVLEHWLAQVLEVLALILTGLPFLGLGYCLGGVRGDLLWTVPVGLLLWTMQLAAVGLLVSSRSRTSARAILTLVLTGVAWLVGMALVLHHWDSYPSSWSEAWLWVALAPLPAVCAVVNSDGLPLGFVAIVIWLPLLPTAALLALVMAWPRRVRGPVVTPARAAARPRSLPDGNPVCWRFRVGHALGRPRSRLVAGAVVLLAAGVGLAADLRTTVWSFAELTVMGLVGTHLAIALQQERQAQSLAVLCASVRGAPGVVDGYLRGNLPLVLAGGLAAFGVGLGADALGLRRFPLPGTEHWYQLLLIAGVSIGGAVLGAAGLALVAGVLARSVVSAALGILLLMGGWQVIGGCPSLVDSLTDLVPSPVTRTVAAVLSPLGLLACPAAYEDKNVLWPWWQLAGVACGQVLVVGVLVVLCRQLAIRALRRSCA